MRGPSGCARHREDRREGLPRDRQRIEQDRGEELDIGLQRPLRILLAQRCADIGLDLAGKRQVGAVGGQRLDRGLEHVGARIAHAIDAVAKTHHPLAARQRRIHPGLDPLARADRIQHFQHRLRRAAMQRTGQRAIAGGDGSEQIGLRRGHHARGEGRGVHAVVAGGDEIGVQRGDLARLRRRAVQHAKRIGGMAHVRIRRDRIEPLGAPDQRARDHRKRADDGGLVLQPVLGAKARDRRTKPVDDAHAVRRRQQVRQPREGALARRAQARPDIGFAEGGLAGAVPEPGGDALEARLGGQAADMLAGDDQLAALAVDMAQHGFGRGNAVQPDLAFGEVDVHGPNLLFTRGKSGLSTD